jgi:hypothetical protein
MAALRNQRSWRRTAVALPTRPASQPQDGKGEAGPGTTDDHELLNGFAGGTEGAGSLGVVMCRTLVTRHVLDDLDVGRAAVAVLLELALIRASALLSSQFRSTFYG